jgi:hypothetical protein
MVEARQVVLYLLVTVVAGDLLDGVAQEIA